MARDVLRRVQFSPYGAKGARFFLVTWATNRRVEHSSGEWIGYQLSIREQGKTRVLFTGEDIGSAMNAIDSDECVRAIMSFLTLRPGDTDAEYFRNYTEDQLEYCTHHAEYLGYAASSRYEKAC